MNVMHLSRITLLPTSERVETYPESLTDLLPQSVVSWRRHAHGSPKSQPKYRALDLDPYLGLSGLSVQHPVLVPHPEIDTCSPGPRWGKVEHTVSVHVPQMTGTVVSLDPGIPASEGNPVSNVPASGNGNMSSIQPDLKSRLDLGPDSLDLDPETLVKLKPSASFSS